MQLAEQAKSNVEGGPWIAGDRMTIADIACFSWLRRLEALDIDASQWTHVKNWLERIAARPAVQRGLSVPESSELSAEEKVRKTT